METAWKILVLCVFLSSGSCFTCPSCPLFLLPDSPFPLLSWNTPLTDSFTRSWSCSWEPQLTLQPCTCGPNTLQSLCCKGHTTTVVCISGQVGIPGHVVVMQSALGYSSIFCLMTYHLIYNDHMYPVGNAKLNPICHLLALVGTHQILYVSRVRVKRSAKQ